MPTLQKEVVCVWRAFSDLHSQRAANGFAPVPLGTSDIVHWLDLHQVKNADRRLWFYELIIELDRVWLKKVESDSDKSKKPKKAKK